MLAERQTVRGTAFLLACTAADCLQQHGSEQPRAAAVLGSGMLHLLALMLWGEPCEDSLFQQPE